MKQTALAALFVAVMARLAVLAIAWIWQPFTLQDLMSHSDTPAYTAIADYLQGSADLPTAWFLRVFPGWSYLLALFYGFDLQLVAVVLSILLAGAAASLFHLLVGDKALTWLFVFLSPAFLFQSVLGMSESFLLVLELAALCCHLSGRHALSGLLLGVAGVTRPTAIFVFIPVLIELMRKQDFKAVAAFMLAAACLPMLMLGINVLVFDDLLLQLNQYLGLPNIGASQREMLGLAVDEGSHFGWPLKNLVLTSLLTDPPLWKQFYIWAHVAGLGLALWMAFARKPQEPLDFIFRWWALGNAVFILSTGEYWAFHSFDRYFIWALPAYVYFLARLPLVNRFPVSALAVLSTATALIAMLRFTG